MEEGRLRGEVTSYLTGYFGTEGLARVHPSIMKVQMPTNVNAGANAATARVILRCRRGEEQSLIAGLALCSTLGGQKARLEVRRISGTIRALMEKEDGKKLSNAKKKISSS
jgi:RNase P/RNase MRP subunit POP5